MSQFTAKNGFLFVKSKEINVIIRASDRSRKKKSNFAGFFGTNSWKNLMISREFSGVFGVNFTKKQSVKNG